MAQNEKSKELLDLMQQSVVEDVTPEALDEIHTKIQSVSNELKVYYGVKPTECVSGKEEPMLVHPDKQRENAGVSSDPYALGLYISSRKSAASRKGDLFYKSFHSKSVGNEMWNKAIEYADENMGEGDYHIYPPLICRTNCDGGIQVSFQNGIIKRCMVQEKCNVYLMFDCRGAIIPIVTTSGRPFMEKLAQYLYAIVGTHNIGEIENELREISFIINV